jgi:hypothetical protein
VNVLLSEYVSLQRRYSRAVNLERDLSVAGAVDGYVVTPRAQQVLARIFRAIELEDSARAWSLTGVYGTGKSAFAHYLASLLAPRESALRQQAVQILSASSPPPELQAPVHRLPGRGLVRAVAVGQREPITKTVLRALRRGAEDYWRGTVGRRPRVLRELASPALQQERTSISNRTVLELAQHLADASQGGLVLILDELGKNLEHAAASGSQEDLFLLQQLAELMQSGTGKPILIVALLHQGFADYSAGLSADRRLEWQKVQGRFEDIAFADAPEQMIHLMATAITKKPSGPVAHLRTLARAWRRSLQSASDPYLASTLSEELIERLLPLHPVTAVVVPSLCTRYAQNDRSLFTFLTGEEPHSFARFLREESVRSNHWPTLKIANLYDYFFAAVSPSHSFRPGLQRWAEIQAVLDDARSLEPDALALLKTIGVLNLVSTSGPVRASRELVTAASMDTPGDADAVRRWHRRLDELVSKGLITYRQRLDEYRIWEGSDFEVDVAVRNVVTNETRTLEDVLSAAAPLTPLIAHRHSHETGTLRCFERRYVSSEARLLEAPHVGIDGVLAYWVSPHEPERLPARLPDGRPLIVVVVNSGALDLLGATAREATALATLDQSEPSLQRDGVARREVRHRLSIARRELSRAAFTAFGRGTLRCRVLGERAAIEARDLSAHLSGVCNDVYSERVVLRNELINRRELTSQGARARRELIAAMIEHGQEERLGLKGDGPEVSMYGAVLLRSGIHRPGSVGWEFGPPATQELLAVWKAIESFCLDATTQPRKIESLFALLQAPPFGLKAGPLPVLLTAVLLHHTDEVGVYRDGSFLPLLGAEQFEILVKQPSRFAVKSLALCGLRLEVLRELETVLQVASRKPPGLRNQTILSVVRPLVQFARSLPESTIRTRDLSLRAIAVRDALLMSTEPDELLFRTLPESCGLEPIDLAPHAGASDHSTYRRRLLETIRELQGAFERRLESCRSLLHSAFSVRSDPSRLREDLRVRSLRLLTSTLEPRLRAFLHASVDTSASEQRWLEAILTILVDKPADAWADEDYLAFELRLTEIARRFRDVEAVVHDAAAPDRLGFDARRVTITAPDGHEVHRLVWIDEPTREAARSLYASLLEKLQKYSIEQQYGVIAALSEEVLGQPTPSSTRMEAKRDR